MDRAGQHRRDDQHRSALGGPSGLLIDAYSEFATLFALRVRPQSVDEAAAVRAAQQELERLVTYPSRGRLLASLVEGILKTLT